MLQYAPASSGLTQVLAALPAPVFVAGLLQPFTMMQALSVNARLELDSDPPAVLSANTCACCGLSAPLHAQSAFLSNPMQCAAI